MEDLDRQLREGKLEQSCPECGRVEDGGPLILVGTPNGINDYYEFVEEITQHAEEVPWCRLRPTPRSGCGSGTLQSESPLGSHFWDRAGLLCSRYLWSSEEGHWTLGNRT